VTADEFTRSLRGVAAFLNRRPDALRDFEISVAGFWRSFAAIGFTAPAYVVALALVRRQLGLDVAGSELFDDAGLMLTVAFGHVAGFVALPLVMILIARQLDLGARYVPFVIVSNWLQVFGSFALAVPGALLLAGWETPSLTMLFTTGFAAVLLHVQWFVTRVTLSVGGVLAACITALGLALSLLSGVLVHALV